MLTAQGRKIALFMTKSKEIDKVVKEARLAA